MSCQAENIPSLLEVYIKRDLLNQQPSFPTELKSSPLIVLKCYSQNQKIEPVKVMGTDIIQHHRWQLLLYARTWKVY